MAATPCGRRTIRPIFKAAAMFLRLVLSWSDQRCTRREVGIRPRRSWYLVCSTESRAHIAAHVQQVLPDETALLYRALVVQSAQWPAWAETTLTRLRNPFENLSQLEKQALQTSASHALRCLGYGVPDEQRATANTDHRTTLITSGEAEIKAAGCHIYQVPIPPELRQQADEFDIRIDVTLSYVAQPRRYPSESAAIPVDLGGLEDQQSRRGSRRFPRAGSQGYDQGRRSFAWIGLALDLA